MARELESRWNQQLRAAAELEEEYRREQARGLAPLTEDEKSALRVLVGALPTRWHAAATIMDERQRRLRCLIGQVILDRDQGAKGRPGVTTIQIGWRSGAWTTLQVPRPGSGDHRRTPEPLLTRIRALAGHETDEHIAALLNADGLTTRLGLAWTGERVHRVRAYHALATACPTMPQDDGARGDGLISVRAAAQRLGVSPTVFEHGRRWGFVQTEQRVVGSPLWLRLSDADFARLDGTSGAAGCGQWRLREAQRVLGLSRQQLWEQARRGELVAYRTRRGRHWEWRLSPRTTPPSSIAARPGDSPASSCSCAPKG